MEKQGSSESKTDHWMPRREDGVRETDSKVLQGPKQACIEKPQVWRAWPYPEPLCLMTVTPSLHIPLCLLSLPIPRPGAPLLSPLWQSPSPTHAGVCKPGPGEGVAGGCWQRGHNQLENT
ncbi:PREDICTED: LOW QUALITY PROTEIN: uncharacterized protein LOC103596697 [Galeopterus variegatus]|uniref:LOW QUALITY PROTEIN: uncharacterized protein LOC103596697 n=1 Tax=Galeopterus variegatus TaxID=482537 RepID=A0ABM0RDC1_GALVR|nr:PREDICTED: LOW QUALITY PROTEIN: uncharacterized protein LOC103596697 [Galeopterus variegatus]